MNARLALTLALLFVAAITASAQSTAFTYQGHLMDAGASANGNYDIQFTLKNALTAGSTVGTPQGGVARQCGERHLHRHAGLRLHAF